MGKCCLCLAREAAGVFELKQVFKNFDGRELENVLRAPFCSKCKDKGIERVWQSVGECALNMALEPTVASQETPLHEWREFSEQEAKQ